MTGRDVVRAGRRYLGVRWVHQGRTIHGLDCVGLIVAIARDLDLPHKDIKNYDRRPSDGLLEQILSAQLRKLKRSDAAPGDIATFEDRSARVVCHVGILTDGEQPFGLLHAWLRRHEHVNRRGVVEMRLDPDWQARLRGVYRFRGLEPCSI